VRARTLLAGYLALGVADTVFAACGVDGPRWVTKALLMPALAAFAYRAARADARRDLPLVLGALAGGWVGDVGLLIDSDTTFMLGMAGFAVGHVCYIAAFRRAGSAPARWMPAVYALAWAALMALVWRGLDDMLVPVLAYSLLLTVMAVYAAGVPGRAWLGGVLFLLSDAVIALGIADVRPVPGQDAVVMPTYVAAQLLLVLTWARPPYGRAKAAVDRSTAAVRRFARLR